MSREEVGKSKIEDEKLGLRRSQRHRSRFEDTRESSAEVESEIEENTRWSLGDGSSGNRTVIESEDSVPGESEYSFGYLSTTAYCNHTFEGGQTSSTPSFRGVIEKEKKIMSKEGKSGSVDSGLGKIQESSMTEFMKMFVLDQNKREDRRDQERREDLIRREEQAKRDEAERERDRIHHQQMFEAALARSKVADYPAPTPSVRLPTLREDGDVEAFISSFSTMLKVAEVPKRLWKRELVTHLSEEALARVSEVLEEDDSTFDEVVSALRGGMALSFGSAAEDFFSGEKGAIWELGMRSCIGKLKHLVMTMARDADSIEDVAERIAIAAARDRLTPPLKNIIDTGLHFSYRPFVDACEQWIKAQPKGVSYFRKPRFNSIPGGKMNSSVPFNKRE